MILNLFLSTVFSYQCSLPAQSSATRTQETEELAQRRAIAEMLKVSGPVGEVAEEPQTPREDVWYPEKIQV